MPVLQVKGMRCEHCRKAVLDAVSAIPGVMHVEVDLQQGTVSWEESAPDSSLTVEQIKDAISVIGFDPE